MLYSASTSAQSSIIFTDVPWDQNCGKFHLSHFENFSQSYMEIETVECLFYTYKSNFYIRIELQLCRENIHNNNYYVFFFLSYIIYNFLCVIYYFSVQCTEKTAFSLFITRPFSKYSLAAASGMTGP